VFWATKRNAKAAFYQHIPKRSLSFFIVRMIMIIVIIVIITMRSLNADINMGEWVLHLFLAVVVGGIGIGER
jgi:hypothetical protein